MIDRSLVYRKEEDSELENQQQNEINLKIDPNKVKMKIQDYKFISSALDSKNVALSIHELKIYVSILIQKHEELELHLREFSSI